MPVGVVKTKKDEDRWERAKDVARKRLGARKGKQSFWAFTNYLFQRMKGKR